MRFSQPVIITFCAFALAACTQEPAPIALRGQDHFAQNGVQPAAQTLARYTPPASYSAPSSAGSAPVAAETASVARVESVSSNELQPIAARKQEEEEHKPVTLTRIDPQPTAKPVKPEKQVSSAGMIWPVQGRVVSHFGPKGKGAMNDGIQISSAEGEPVYAASGGEVVYVGDELKGYGNMVILKHKGNKHTTYAHLYRASVARYDRVKQGEMIGYVGSTGNVSKPQLFFAVRQGNKPVDPEAYLPQNVASIK